MRVFALAASVLALCSCSYATEADSPPTNSLRPNALRVAFTSEVASVSEQDGRISCTVRVTAAATGGSDRDPYAMWNSISYTATNPDTGVGRSGSIQMRRDLADFWGSDRIWPGETLVGHLEEVEGKSPFEVEFTIRYDIYPWGDLRSEHVPPVLCSP